MFSSNVRAIIALAITASLWWLQAFGANVAPILIYPGLVPSCSQSIAWISRFGQIESPNNSIPLALQKSYDTMICGMVSDGTWSLTDVFYIYATVTQAISQSNLVSSTNYAATVSGTATFTAYQGWASDGSSGYLNTNFVPSTAGGHFTQNSSALLTYNISTRSGGNTSQCSVGVANSTGIDYSFIAPDNNLLGFQAAVNTTTNINVSGQTAAAGAWVISRTGSTSLAAYKNGNTTAIGSNTSASTALPALSVLSHACRFGSGGTPSNFSSDLIAAQWVGGGLSATQASSLANRINTYMGSLSTPINLY
jgi:hypothetical protein